VAEEFWRAALNTADRHVCVVCISLTIGTLGGYALARSPYRYAFWLLIAGAGVPRHAADHAGVGLPAAVLPMEPLGPPAHHDHRAGGDQPALHAVDAAPASFRNIPKDLDESAMVDGCSRFQAFRHVIIPVMWPGVITTGLFSFLLAYNDFAVTSMLLSKENQTMVPKIASFLGTTQTKGNVMFAVAAGRVGHRAAVRPGPGLPAPDRQRPDRRRRERITMAEIQLSNLSKRWGSFTGVKPMDLTIGDGEFLVLLGPSGCGKTTTMRMIAGLEDATEGDILIGGRGSTTWSPRTATSRWCSSPTAFTRT
jgi:ABC-type multidrug transport system fused ATPase/permease subunit